MNNVLNEKDIKAAVIQKIRTRIKGEEFTLINEMVFKDKSRRADLVIAAKNLHAFEIKSDVDTLKRLDGQMGDYLETFDKVTLVVSSKYVTDALSFNQRVGVWEAYKKKNGTIAIRVLRAGKTQPISSYNILCNFLLKQELIELVRASIGKLDLRNYSREDLIQLCDQLPLSTIRKAALNSVTCRYQDLSHMFLEKCSNTVTPADLCNLSKSKTKKRLIEESLRDSKREKPTTQLRAINLERFFPSGDVPDSIPRFILVPEF